MPLIYDAAPLEIFFNMIDNLLPSSLIIVILFEIKYDECKQFEEWIRSENYIIILIAIFLLLLHFPRNELQLYYVLFLQWSNETVHEVLVYLRTVKDELRK